MPDDAFESLANTLHAARGCYAVLLGSGVSSDAGIKTAWNITLMLIRKYAASKGVDPRPDPAAWFRETTGKEPNYSAILEAWYRSQGDRSRALQPEFENRQPSEAHTAVAQLASAGVVRIILTTNFDQLMEKALWGVGIDPNVVKSPSDAANLSLAGKGVILVKLHGDYTGEWMLNTPAELESYDPELDVLLDRVLREYGVFTCGWSAEWDKALVDALARNGPGCRFSFYWADPKKPSSAVERLFDAYGNAAHIHIETAGEFLPRLKESVFNIDRVETEADPKAVPPRFRSWKLAIAAALAATAAAAGLVLVSGAPTTPLPCGLGAELHVPKLDSPELLATTAEARRLYLGGWALYRDYDLESVRKARQMFEEALENDPGFALARSASALTHWLDWEYQWAGGPRDLTVAYEEARRAAVDDPREPEIQRRLAWIEFFRADRQQAMKRMEQALQAHPGFADGCAYYAQMLNFSGRPDEALELAQAAIALRPEHPQYYEYYLAHAHWLLGRPEQALESLPDGVSMPPALRLQAVSYVEIGRLEDARATMARVHAVSPAATLDGWGGRMPYSEDTTRSRYLQALAAAGEP